MEREEGAETTDQFAYLGCLSFLAAVEDEVQMFSKTGCPAHRTHSLHSPDTMPKPFGLLHASEKSATQSRVLIF